MVEFPASKLREQLARSWSITKKDILIYYYQGPVVVFGVLFPLFLFLAFYIGREVALNFLVPGMLSMSLFFTATSVSPVIAPWETRLKTLERLVSAPISISAMILGDVIASFIFGIAVSTVPLLAGFAAGVYVTDPLILSLCIVLASFCFSSFGLMLSSPPSDVPSNVMMFSTFLKFPLVFISGIFVPIEKMGPWGIIIASGSPLTYLTDLLRYSYSGSSYYPVLLDLSVLLAFTALFFLAAVKLHEKTLPRRL
ncbi:ABC transporter permease [Candidatus Bathyarchaeota archaeon]|nr:ABC transporter permease [Candidatus Bathyarchaeota archaeon]